MRLWSVYVWMPAWLVVCLYASTLRKSGNLFRVYPSSHSITAGTGSSVPATQNWINGGGLCFNSAQQLPYPFMGRICLFKCLCHNMRLFCFCFQLLLYQRHCLPMTCLPHDLNKCNSPHTRDAHQAYQQAHGNHQVFLSTTQKVELISFLLIGITPTPPVYSPKTKWIFMPV